MNDWMRKLKEEKQNKNILGVASKENMKHLGLIVNPAERAIGQL